MTHSNYWTPYVPLVILLQFSLLSFHTVKSKGAKAYNELPSGIKALSLNSIHFLIPGFSGITLSYAAALIAFASSV